MRVTGRTRLRLTRRRMTRRQGGDGQGRHALLSVVIPAYNEEGSLAAVLQRVLAVRDGLRSGTHTVQDVEVIVVDDGSTDQTAEAAAAFPSVAVIRQPTNLGYGHALKTGFQTARGDYISFLDADGTYPPEELPRLCRALEKWDADVVVGSRMSGAAGAMPRERYLGNRVFASLLTWLVGRRVTDTASGMRVFRRSVLPKLLPLPDGLHLTPAMSARALYEGLRVVEVPIRYHERVGRSKLNVVLDGVRFLNVILGIARLYNPWRLFGTAGLLFLALGAWLSLDPVAYYLQVRRVEETEIYRLLSIMVLFVTGLSLISFGGFASSIVEMIHLRAVPHGRVGEALLRPKALARAGWIGLLLMAAAPVLNYRAIIEYVTTGQIHLHWVYILTGAFLFLVGLQLVMGSVLVGIVQELKRTAIREG